MLSIGWVIFWKAVIVAIASAIYGRWQSLKKQYALNLRPDGKGVYRPDNRLQRAEDVATRGFWIAFATFNVFAFYMVGVLLGYWA